MLRSYMRKLNDNNKKINTVNKKLIITTRENNKLLK